MTEIPRSVLIVFGENVTVNRHGLLGATETPHSCESVSRGAVIIPMG